MVVRKILDTNYEEAQIEVPPEQKNFYYYGTISLYLLAVLLALIVNSTFVTALIKGWKIFSQRPFYMLLGQLVVANVLAILINMVCTVPVVLFLSANETRSYVQSEVYTVANTFGWISDQLSQWLILMIAFHRLLVFMKPRKDANIFSMCTLCGILTAIWVISILSTSFMTWANCYFQFDYVDKNITGMYHFQCNLTGTLKGKEQDAALTENVSYVFFGQKILFPVLVFLCYLAIVVKLVIMSQTTHHHYGEIMILRQGIFIFLMFQISSLIMVIAFSTELQMNTAFLIKRMVATSDMAAAALSPLFIIVTSKEIQNVLFRKGITVWKTAASPTSSLSSKKIYNYPRKGTI